MLNTKQTRFCLGQENSVRDHMRVRSGYSRLCLDGHAPIKRDRVKGVREAVLHILLEIDAASGAGAFVVAARATDVASRSSRVARGDTRGGAHGLIAFWGRAGVLAVSGVLGGL